MKSGSALLVILALLAVQAPAANSAGTQEPDSRNKTPAGKRKALSGPSLSGCVDQQEGRYVLVDDRNLSSVADLESDGFPTEGFAKYLGQKVTVRGTSNSGNTRSVFKVRSIEILSETCAPTRQTDKK